MGKTTTPAKAKSHELVDVVVQYDLFDLPTAFHKAGLAGLLLLIESLKSRNHLCADEAKYVHTATSAEVVLTSDLVQKLLDDVYDAKTVEVRVKSKWVGADLKEELVTEEVVNGKVTRTKYFVYDQVQPKGAFFDNVFADDKEAWRKLWRDMLWTIPRGRPTTRIPFNERATRKPCSEGTAAWADLVKVHKAHSKGAFCTAEISSALLPGAQAVNAESVPFEGRAEQNFLLHFWPLTVLLFVPQAIEVDGSSDFAGYTLVVPEVSNLSQFLDDYPILLNGLSKDIRGYRPAQAVIDIAAEGALAFLDRLAMVTSQRVQGGELRYSIGGVEYLHLVKTGNNIKTVASGRVSPNAILLAEYRQLVAPPDESLQFRNPLFRRGLLLALLESNPWYRPFCSILATFDVELFIRQSRRSDNSSHNSEEGKRPPQFANDALKKFHHDTRLFASLLERNKSMPDAERPKAPLSVIINRVVRSYLLARTSEKSKIKLDSFENDDEKIDWKAVPQDFNDTKQKLAMSLMLEFRSRKEQAFVDHFAATFFSVSQRIVEVDRLELADALTNTDRREDLKILTLLSLSANS